MNETALLASQVKLKVVRLLQQLGEYRQISEKLEMENLKLNSVIHEQKKIIENLEEKNKIVKIAEALTFSKGDVHELKLKVNEYIREIDECIRLLSDS
ncbi:MAG: hypothetical protein ACHQK8_00605 [Bacteroidia bacterium]